MFSSGKALIKNTTRMGGDFLSNLKGMALPARKEHGGTFAPEIKNKSIQGLLIKSKREVIGILLIISSKEKKQ